MAKIRGKQIGTGTNGIQTANLEDGAVTAVKTASTIVLTDGTRAMAADLAMGTNKITGLAAPIADTDAARKQDVDAVAAGLAWKDAMRLATDAALPAVTYANGTLGVGATLTADAVGVLTVDGVATVLNDRLLVKNQVAGLQNGLYDMTTEGTGGVAFVLTRVVEADESAELDSATAAIQVGTVNADTRWTQTASAPTIGTTALTFTNIGGLGEVTAGTGLTKTVNTINAIGGDGITANADDLAVDLKAAGGLKIDTAEIAVEPADFAGTGLEDDGADNLRLAAAAAGAGLGGGAGSALAVGAHADASVTVNAADIQAHRQSTANRQMVGSVTVADGDKAAITTIAAAHTAGGMDLFVNGVLVNLGETGLGTDDAYIGQGDTTTVRTFADVVAGDTVRWNGSIAGFELDGTDLLDLRYTIAP